MTEVALRLGRARVSTLLAWMLPIVVALGLISGSAIAAEQGGAPATAEADPAQAEYVGAARCRSCHSDAARHFSHTVHNAVFERNPRNELERRNCEACHGPGAAHVADPKVPGAILSFNRKQGVDPKQLNAKCLACHSGGERIQWHGSRHEVQELACTDCHNPMTSLSQSGLLRSKSISEVCMSCHQQQRVDFKKRSHMPLEEGKISCVDCHNPHGGNSAPLLKTTTVNQVCYECHAEKRGPFIWEHAPVRESCMNCHQAHGSNNDFLLTVARPFLCQQCHSALRHPNDLQTTAGLANGAAPDERLINRSCQNCHTQIHGSNHPSGVRMHR